MSEPNTGTPVQRAPRTAPQVERPVAGRASPEPLSPRKPTGPITYKLEKGANVWPGRK